MSKIGVYNNKLGIGSTSPSTLVHVESDPPTGQPLQSNIIITLKNITMIVVKTIAVNVIILIIMMIIMNI